VNNRDELVTRLTQVLELVKREDEHLSAVFGRFFFDIESVEAEWLGKVLATPEGIDRLESFVGKFTRMQDTMIDKLVPLFLNATGEPVGTAIDNLNRMEKLGFIQCSESWVELRRLRNRLVHEYMEELEEMAAALDRAFHLMSAMRHTYISIKEYTASTFGGLE